MAENQRIRLSKKMLKDALIDLLQEKNLSEVTVQQICEKAEINRTTFYKFYDNPIGLLADIENDFLNDFNDIISAGPKGKETLMNVLRYLYKNKNTFWVLMRYLDSEFIKQLFQVPAIVTNYDKISQETGLSDSKVHYIHQFANYGILAVICEWLFGEGQESPEEMAEIISVIGRKHIND